jgi:hypothetical protein
MGSDSICLQLARLAVFTLCVTVLSAQTNTSAIAGQIKDATGGSVASATVTVTELGTGQARTSTASVDGEFVVPQLPPGRYDVKVEAKGFQTALASGVVLEIAQRARLDFTMKVGALSQQIDVSARAAVMDTDTASLG